LKRMPGKVCWFGFLLCLCFPNATYGEGGSWLRPNNPDGPLVWGRTDGVVFGLPSAGGMPGPRGLIRVGIFGSTSHHPERINFITVQPVTLGPGGYLSRTGFSELEQSRLDPGKAGMRLWVHIPEGQNRQQVVSGELETLPAKPQPIEQLTVRIDVEPYPSNGARVHVMARMQSTTPDEIAFSVFQDEGSAPLEEIALSSTAGSYERLRYLWLRNRLVDSRVLYKHDSENAFGFMERENYPLVDMLRNWDGDAVVFCTANEVNPAAIIDLKPLWANYGSVRLTHYWIVPAKDMQPDLRVRVNGRRVYWMSQSEIPGGKTFENFEVRQRYVPGQVFIFGLTPKEPWQFEPPLPDLPQLPQR